MFLDAVNGPLHPLARETLAAALDVGWADPRRLHREGRLARQLLDQSREILATGLGLHPSEVSLHPSPAHALNAGLQGLRGARRRAFEQVVSSAIDQAAVLRQTDPAATVPVDGDGRIDPDRWRAAVAAPGVAAAVTALGNAEIATTQEVAPLADACAGAGVPLLLDVGAAWGRVPVPPAAHAYAADTASFGGPALGVLGVRTGTRLSPMDHPGAPEHGRERAVPFLPLALAAAEAWRQQQEDLADDGRRAHALIERIRRAAAALPDVQVVGHPDLRLPHIVTFSVLYVPGEQLVLECDRRGYAVASGSACTADTLEPSHVLAAIGAITHGNVRLTLPVEAVAPDRQAQVERFCRELPDIVASVRDHLDVSAPVRRQP